MSGIVWRGEGLKNESFWTASGSRGLGLSLSLGEFRMLIIIAFLASYPSRTYTITQLASRCYPNM